MSPVRHREQRNPMLVKIADELSSGAIVADDALDVLEALVEEPFLLVELLMQASTEGLPGRTTPAGITPEPSGLLTTLQEGSKDNTALQPVMVELVRLLNLVDELRAAATARH